MRHVGQWLGFTAGATREGIGYSPHSAQHALQSACFYGTRPIVDQAVVQGRDGFYAVIHYR